jgi:hypothetical protein
MSALALVMALTVAFPASGRAITTDLTQDTVVELRRGDRVVVSGLSGRVTVEAVTGDRLEVTSARRTDEVGVRHANGRVVVGAAGRGGPGRAVDLRLRVPAWAELEIDGMDLDVAVRGMAGSVSIGTISGDVRIEGTSGRVRARSMAGEIVAESTSGPLSLSSHGDDVRVRGASGPVEAQSLGGDLFLDALRSTSVRAETQAGDVTFEGDIIAGGNYRFFLHSGDARLVLPRNLSARIRVSTFHGSLESDFPVQVSGFTSGRPFEFTVGDGGAEVRVEVFDGEIRLVQGNR